MTAIVRCRVCGRPLRDRASVAEGAGPVCAVRAAQVLLDLASAETELLLRLGVAPAAIPAALAARERARLLGLVGMSGCDGCLLYVCCAAHSPPPSGVRRIITGGRRCMTTTV